MLMLLNVSLTGRTCFVLMAFPVLTLSPPPHHSLRARRCPLPRVKPATAASLVTAAPTAKEATASSLACSSLSLGPQKKPSLSRSSPSTTTTTTITYQTRGPCSP